MRRWHTYLLIGFYLAVIYAVPLTQAALEVSRGAWPQALDLFSSKPTATNLRAYERELERSSSIVGAVRPWVQYTLFTLVRSPGESAVLGRDGWLFYKPDLRFLVEPCTQPVPVIQRFRDQLAHRGIRLLVVPVPGKPSVLPDRLTTRFAAENEPLASHTTDLLMQLRAVGVETVDLLDSLALRSDGEPSYLQRDTHWSGATARRAAEFVAAKVRANGWVDQGSTEYAIRPVMTSRRGDVVRMMDVPQLEREFPPDRVRCEQVVAKNTGALYTDDLASPVLVLGDSFLRIYETDEPRAAGFIAHLARALGRPVASIINDGGASTLVRQQLARRPELLAGKRLVIWEFVERDIRFGVEGWQDVSLGDTP